jgi:atypical dual specificity phosphatase
MQSVIPPEYRFSWIVADQIGACAYPLHDSDWATLREVGIDVLINLHPRAHPPAALQQRQVEQVHIPVTDLTPPTQQQIDQGLQAIEDALARGRRVVVHCGAGMGRTGTLLACYFVKTGLSAEDAIALVRARRPGSIETAEQEQSVQAYATRTTRHASS